jgi:tetratricopeptide (TPR) repeat protein
MTKKLTKTTDPLKKTPVNIAFELHKGVQYHQAGQLPEAAAAFNEILYADPKNSAALNMLGLVYSQAGKVQEAIELMNRSVQIDPTNPIYYNNLGNVVAELGRTDDAISYYQKAIKLNPNYPEAHFNMGEVLANIGDFNKAIPYYRKTLELKPDFAKAFFSLALAKKNTSEELKELIQLAERLVDNQITADDLILKSFALGKIHHDLGIFDKAFEYYRHGNKLERNKHKFSIEGHVKYVSRIIEKFSVEFIEERRSWGVDTKTPIFIFGMPRSGTTLVETILSSHQKVCSAGETVFFSRLGGMPNTEYLDRVKSETALNTAESYVSHLRDSTSLSEHCSYIIDKNPENFLVLGLLFILFPKARFIHCQRNTLDNCLSIYFHKFSRGYGYAYDLKDIGLYFKEYQRLMAHWRLVGPRILEIKYEELVHRQEDVTRELLDYCELEWDSNCLDFYENRNPIFTTSWEVRQPIYTSSVNRWEKYAQFIEPLRTLFPDCL